MHIAVIAPPWLPVPPVDYGGTELIVDILCRGYAAAGHQVVLYCTGESTCPVERRSVIAAGHMPPDKHAEHRHFAFALENIRMDSFDIIHTHLEGFIPYARLLDIPVICTVHVPMTPARSRLLADSGSVPIIAVSHDQAASLPCPAEVIHHGIEFDRYQLAPERDGYLLWLGSISPEKGVEHSLELARKAGCKLVLAGPVANGQEEWWRQIYSSGARNLEWTGPVEFDRKVELLARAVALLMPVSWQEPFGLVAVEAMACGTPVIASRAGALPELIEDGLTGFACEGMDEMEAAIQKSRDLDSSAIRNAARKRYSASRMIKHYLQHISPG